MKKFSNFSIILAIALLNFIFFSYKLNEVPNGIYVDEAVSGVNAYSILKTGRDEYGKEFPIAFRFFGSYSPPLYVYLTTIPVYLFDLNEYSVRIVSVVASTLMVFIIYFFLKSSKIFDKKLIPYLLLIFIITPWNYFFGRTGYELYLGFFMLSLGVLFMWFSLEKNKYIIPGLTVLSIATYCSHPNLYIVPIFILGFVILFTKQIKTKFLMTGILLFAFIQIPHLLIVNSKAFFNKSDLFYLDEILLNAEFLNLPRVLTVPFSFAFSFFARTFAYFSPKSLFFFSDPDLQRSIPELSVFYNWMVLPFLTGIYFFFKSMKNSFNKILSLLIIATIIPASLTKDPFSTQRALGLMLPLFLIITMGVSIIYNKLSIKIFSVIFIFIFCFSAFLLWRSYFILLPSERAIIWNYGYKQLSEFIYKNKSSKFVIDQSRGKPAYIELAFFLKTNPKILQSSVNPEIKTDYYNLNEFNPDYSFENVELRAIKWEEDIYKNQILVGDEIAISPNQIKEHFLKEVFSIADPRGYPVLKAYQTDPDKKCKETDSGSAFCLRN